MPHNSTNTLPKTDTTGPNIHEQLKALPDVSYDAEAKARFRDLAMRVLRDLAHRLKLEAGTYDLRYNAGGIAVSGEATLHGERLYVQISQDGIFNNSPEVLYRACKGREDYCGERNQFCRPTELTQTDTLIRMKAILETGFDDGDRLIIVTA